MSIVIYGAGKKGNEALELLKRYGEEKEIKGFSDTYKEGEYLGFPIIPINELEKDITLIIAIIDYELAKTIAKMLKSEGFTKIYWYRYSKKIQLVKSFCLEQCDNCMAWGEYMFEQVEMHIMDSCNLNCRGCAHYSPIFKHEIPNIKERLRDVERLKEKMDGIYRFYLLGGEPFLNPQIGEYVEEIRKILPDTAIYIVTNGLLIPNIDESVLAAISKANVRISISEYEPTHRIIDQICEKLNQNKVLYEVREWNSRKKFSIPLSLEVKPKEEQWCISNKCYTIWNGKIARCPQVMYIEYFNKHFNTNFPSEGALDLEADISRKDLLDYLKKEIPLCKHCGKCEIEWTTCGKNPVLSDFVMDV